MLTLNANNKIVLVIEFTVLPTLNITCAEVMLCINKTHNALSSSPVHNTVLIPMEVSHAIAMLQLAMH